ncbi:glycosyltransferase family 4 protein [Winogradskyella sp. PE311]|uniref:glycosyltransferase family 4 protein n=1 Tax=Winogradskyella sp. PE311 TaxID=3366943 RepID=UPI00398069A8
MRKRLLIIGPLSDIGGRELETGFIAETLSDDYDVKILSTGNLTSNSQIFDFVSAKEVITLNEKIAKESIWFKTLAFFSYIKACRKEPFINYVSNNLAKKTGYRKFAITQIINELDKVDIVVLCAQISSNYVKEIAEYAYSKHKKIVLRTSTTINENEVLVRAWLSYIDLFIHHSSSNAKRLSTLNNHNYQLIDQCTFRESEMLNIEPAKIFKSLLYIGRLAPEKGINELIDVFTRQHHNLKLTIIGDGELRDVIEKKILGYDNIQLLGYLDQVKIVEQISLVDTIIIPSYEESGPLVALEAMASARLIISTKVGAMEDRLKDGLNQFWFNINDEASFRQIIDRIIKMETDTILKITKQNRAIYMRNYQQKEIRSQYKKAIFNLIN